MFTFSMMRHPLSWFESVFVHALKQTEEKWGGTDPVCLTDGGRGIWRYCLEPMMKLAKERVLRGKTQSIAVRDTAKVSAFRKWIEVLTTTVPSQQVLQTQSWLSMRSGDTGRPVDCLVRMEDIEWAWEFLRSTYHIFDAPEKPPMTNHVTHVSAHKNGTTSSEEQMYDCATARRVYQYARLDFDVLNMSCEESMPSELAACACA